MPQPDNVHGHQGDDPHHKDFYAISNNFHREFKLKSTKMIEFLERVGINEGAHVLEIGCGFCPLLEHYKQAIGPKGSVTLVDPERRFEEMLTSRMGDNARFLVGTAESDGDEFRCRGNPDGYDLVVLGNVYHHLPDIEKAMGLIMAKMRSGGRIVVFDFVHNTCKFFTKVDSPLHSLIRPDPKSVTARCADTLAACGFVIRHIDNYVMQGKPGSDLWEHFVEFMVPNALNVMVKKGKIDDKERQQLLTKDLKEITNDSDAVLFSNCAVQVAAEKPF